MYAGLGLIGFGIGKFILKPRIISWQVACELRTSSEIATTFYDFDGGREVLQGRIQREHDTARG